MKFFDYIRKFFWFTLKEIYSFFLKLSLFLVIFLIFIFSAVKYFSSRNNMMKSAKDYSYIIFNPSNITEDKIVGAEMFSGSEETNISFADILNSLDSIKENRNIRGVIISLDSTQLSSAKTEEVVKKFEELKKAGKKIYAFGAYIENGNYTLASVADEIIMIPSSSASLSLSGYNYSQIYYRKLLDNLGVDFEVVRIGDYKSYGETYTGNEISPELKSEIERIMENRYFKFTENIAAARKLNRETLEGEILSGSLTNITPFIARDRKLVDKLESFEVFSKRLNINEDKIADIYTYYHQNRHSIDTRNAGNDTIAVIYAEGSIIYGMESGNQIAISPENILQKLKKALKIPRLKGIVLRVNSPGGSALASEMIYQNLLTAPVPIYVSMGETAASGGYYISMVGEKVFADNATITGSIGVVSVIPKFHNAQGKYGFTSNSISKGKYSDMYDPFSPLSEETKTKISESMMETYNEFKSRVSTSRDMDSVLLEEYAQGKIWLGDEAVERKLVDGIAGLDETLKTMAKDLNINSEYRVENIYLEKDFKEFFKIISYLVNEKFGLSAQLEKRIPNGSRLFEEYKMIENSKNRPLFYLTHKFDF